MAAAPFLTVQGQSVLRTSVPQGPGEGILAFRIAIR